MKFFPISISPNSLIFLSSHSAFKLTFFKEIPFKLSKSSSKNLIGQRAGFVLIILWEKYFANL